MPEVCAAHGRSFVLLDALADIRETRRAGDFHR